MEAPKLTNQARLLTHDILLVSTTYAGHPEAMGRKPVHYSSVQRGMRSILPEVVLWIVLSMVLFSGMSYREVRNEPIIIGSSATYNVPRSVTSRVVKTYNRYGCVREPRRKSSRNRPPAEFVHLHLQNCQVTHLIAHLQL